jgi:hypothetical protein
MRSQAASVSLPADRAPWLSVGKGVGTGLLSMVVVFLPLAFFLELLGLPTGSGRDAPTLLGWPYVVDGPWSALTDLTAIAAAVALATPIMQRSVAWMTERDVSWSRTAIVLAVAAPLPFPANTGVLDLGRALGVAATIVGMRYLAVGRDGPARPSGGILLAAGVVAFAAVAVSAAYLVTHPLLTRGPLGPVEGNPRLAGLALENRGHAAATLVSVRATHLPRRFFPLEIASSPPVEVPAHGSADAVLRAPACANGSYTVTVDELDVRYRILGGFHEQRLRVDPSHLFRCP